MSYNRGKNWKNKKKLKGNTSSSMLNHIINEGVFLNVNGIFHPTTGDEMKIVTSLIKPSIDKVKKEIVLSYKILKETSSWLFNEIKNENEYYMNMMFNVENRLTEVLMSELNQSYTIIFNRLYPHPTDDSKMKMYWNINESKDKVKNRWFPTK
jgi:hypothetical protein